MYIHVNCHMHKHCKCTAENLVYGINSYWHWEIVDVSYIFSFCTFYSDYKFNSKKGSEVS